MTEQIGMQVFCLVPNNLQDQHPDNFVPTSVRVRSGDADRIPNSQFADPGKGAFEREGTDLSRGPCVEVRSIPNCCLHKGDYAVLLRPTVDAPCRGEPRGCVNEYARRQQNAVYGG